MIKKLLLIIFSGVIAVPCLLILAALVGAILKERDNQNKNNPEISRSDAIIPSSPKITDLSRPLTDAERWYKMSSREKMLTVQADVKLSKTEWEKGGFGNIALVSTTVENKSKKWFKDLDIVCEYFGPSGTLLSRVTYTAYETFTAGSSKRLRKLNTGLINSQSASNRCEVGSLVVME